MNDWEVMSMGLEPGIMLGLAIKTVMLALAGTLFVIPEFKVGCPATFGVTIGGNNFGKACRLYAGVVSKSSQLIKQANSMSSTLGSYNGRQDEWDLEKAVATKPPSHNGKLKTMTDRQNSIEVNDYMRKKSSNQDLYTGQVSTLYLQSFRLAHDVAKRAQRAYCNELGRESADFIQFGYWDSLKKGLLAGERLYNDLKRTEMSYIEQGARECDITNSLSLAQLDPLTLMQLREKQDAFFAIPEALVQLFVFVNAGYKASYNAITMQFWFKDGPPSEAETDGPPLALASWGPGLRAGRGFKKPAGMWRIKARLADGSKMAAGAFDDILLLAYYSVKYPE
ncbi:MAG: hypothetical protein M1813_003300 [Trichoglossum hirsutum]|nr:MAG: hypothetical protein M1813_003300 [Trichoglossum hirsutum]